MSSQGREAVRKSAPSPSKSQSSSPHASARQEPVSQEDLPPSSPEPTNVPLAETHPDQGDEYGVVAALDMIIEDPVSPQLARSSGPSDKDVDFFDPGSTQGEEPLVPEAIDRALSPSKLEKRPDGANEKRHSVDNHKLYKFSLYETPMRFFIVGGDISNTSFRILKIDRTAPAKDLSIIEDEIVYSKRELSQLLKTINEGNRGVGGLKHKLDSWGLLGFIRFTEGYYMLMITKKQQVATVGGHFIYQVDGTGIVPMSNSTGPRFPGARNGEESRFLSILSNLGLTRSFYFSTSYNVTRTMQHNIIRDRQRLSAGLPLSFDATDFNDMFVWNEHLLTPAFEVLRNPYHWCIPIIHGFVDQSCVNVFGRHLYITILARRSRFFAGARFLKRGANDLGYVANDVETEQIVADMATSSYHPSAHQNIRSANYTSFVQHRGSIPLFWTQDSTGVSPKPAIDLNLIDPFYSSAALHFDNLFARYRAPIYVLNLVKARERTPRESKLLQEYQNAINYLNQELPKGKRIKYRAFDMSRASKSYRRDQDVISTLEEIAEDGIRTTGFFQNAATPTDDEPCTQNGVVRSNCIDCLDRTNAAQFVIGKRALGYQLQALGIITETSLNYEKDASNIYANMFNDHGDTLASQYGGSHLVNTMDSYRKVNNWQSHSRDMLESFKRYYHNSFLDNQRQEAYNLFLGNYIYAQGQPMLWELPNDHYLHHKHPGSRDKRRHYIRWFTPENLKPRSLPSAPQVDDQTARNLTDEWWEEYYKPTIMTSFGRNFAHNMNSTTKYLSKDRGGQHDVSPFSLRGPALDRPTSSQGPSDVRSKKPVAIADSKSREVLSPLSGTLLPQQMDKRISSLQKWLSPGPSEPGRPSNGKDGATNKSAPHSRHRHNESAASAPAALSSPAKPADKSMMHQWTIQQFYENTLNPTVTDMEAAQYERYLETANTEPEVSLEDIAAYESYLQSGRDPDLGGAVKESDLAGYESWFKVDQKPLTVTEHDLEQKRYQAYENYLKGKSLFKQTRVDPEVRGLAPA